MDAIATSGAVHCSAPLFVLEEVLDLILRRAGDDILLALRAAGCALCLLASKDALWQPRAEAAWHGKQRSFLLLRWINVTPVWRAYRGSLRDATRRHLTFDELAEPEFWCIRFKAAAGEGWTSRDPWWQGEAPIKMRLTNSGDVVAVTDARPFYGQAGHVSGCWSAKYDAVHGTTVVDVIGQPPYHVCRHAPTWGVYMESCWCVWTAFDMPCRGESPDLEDEALHVTAQDPTQHPAIARCNARLALRAF